MFDTDCVFEANDDQGEINITTADIRDNLGFFGVAKSPQDRAANCLIIRRGDSLIKSCEGGLACPVALVQNRLNRNPIIDRLGGRCSSN